MEIIIPMKKTILLIFVFILLLIPISLAARYALTVPNYGMFGMGGLLGNTNCPVNTYCHAINTNTTIAYLNFSIIPAGTIMWYEVDT